MKVTIELTTWLKRYAGGMDKTIVDIDAPADADITAVDCIHKAGIPLDEIGLITRNGLRITETCIINDDDTIRVFPTIIGG